MSSSSVRLFYMRYCKGRSSLIKLLINFLIVAICALFLITQLYKHSTPTESFEKLEGKAEEYERRPVVLPVISLDEFVYKEPWNSFFKQKHNVLRQKVDWHNQTHIQLEKGRRGPGEQGKKFKLTDPEDIKRNTMLMRVNGYYAVASDIISPNRSVNDIRHPLCRKKIYYTELPTTSIVIPFFNDHLSVLMRSVHSVINRAPAHLLKEVILVNDHSDKKELYEELQQYLAENFDGKAHVVNLPERSGLITARIAGALVATGDVLLFLDSHIEANTNYLPPLLDPIAEDYRTVVCPFIDVIDAKNYEYRAQDEGQRGGFEWNFLYKRMNIRPEDRDGPADNFPSPVMAGGLFAMSSKFFWEVGGYDPGLDIWGGEQYELSFKIWLCGGQMIDSPCSRIGHIYKSNPFPPPRNGKDYLSTNFKRVAEVWMDEYKEDLYRRKADRYKHVKTGDISKQLEVKERLQCKPFKYFLEVVAPDMVKNYPPSETEFASGTIESVAFKDHCIDSSGQFYRDIVMYSCNHNRKHPSGSQFFFLGQYKEIIYYGDSAYCIQPQGEKLQLHACQHRQKGQYFKYDLDTQQIKHPEGETACIEAGDGGQFPVMKKCDPNEVKQKWIWGTINEDNVRNWDSLNVKFDD